MLLHVALQESNVETPPKPLGGGWEGEVGWWEGGRKGVREECGKNEV